MDSRIIDQILNFFKVPKLSTLLVTVYNHYTCTRILRDTTTKIYQIKTTCLNSNWIVAKKTKASHQQYVVSFFSKFQLQPNEAQMIELVLPIVVLYF